MTYSEWANKYLPIENPSDGSIFWETYGADLETVNEQNPLCVWTDVDDGHINLILNGVHSCNRLGFYITEIPFEEGEDIEVLIRYDDEDDEEGFPLCEWKEEDL